MWLVMLITLIVFVTIHTLSIFYDIYPCMKEIDKCSQLYMQ